MIVKNLGNGMFLFSQKDRKSFGKLCDSKVLLDYGCGTMGDVSYIQALIDIMNISSLNAIPNVGDVMRIDFSEDYTIEIL